MFNKTADTEGVEILTEQRKLARVFDRLGKSEASELEVLRAAQEMGTPVSNLRDYCTISPSGMVGLKK